MTLWVFEGKGRCESATAFVRGETEAAARARLLRDDACPYFEIGASYRFSAAITLPPAKEESC